MIPIRDTISHRRVPVVTIGLALANVAVFLYELSLGPGLDAFVTRNGFVPITFTRWTASGGSPLDPGLYLPILVSMFLHGGWLHLLGNMLYLWIFGDNVEDRLGHAGFLGFYLACGAAAALSHAYLTPDSHSVVIGASGAISGVLGAYLVLYPSSRVLALVPVFLFAWFVEVPAVLFIVLWFVLQVSSGFAALSETAAQAGGVAWWAHVGGFVAGVVLALMFGRVRRRADAA